MSDTVSTDSTYRVTADELRQFIERFERLEMERKDLLDQQKEVLAEAKNRGYDTRVIKKVMAIRGRGGVWRLAILLPQADEYPPESDRRKEMLQDAQHAPFLPRYAIHRSGSWRALSLP